MKREHLILHRLLEMVGELMQYAEQEARTLSNLGRESKAKHAYDLLDDTEKMVKKARKLLKKDTQ